jgi:spore germination protein GerM
MATRMSRVARATVVVMLVAASTGCGVREQSSPQSIDASDVPFGLLESPPTSEGSSANEPARDPFTIYFLGSERLMPVQRQAEHAPGLATALDILAEGPTAEEIALGLQSAVGPESPARPVGNEEDVAVVELTDAFLAGSSDQIVGLAQIVYTLTEIPGLGRVQFLVAGEPVEVPRGDGVLTTEPVSRADYILLAPSS